MKSIRETWYRLSLKRKFLLFFSIIILCISLLNIYTLINAFNYLEIYEQDLIKNTVIHNLQTSVIENNAAFENYIMYSDKNDLSMFNDKIPEIWSNWKRVQETSNNNLAAYFQIYAIRYALLAYMDNVSKTSTSMETGGTDFIDDLLKTRRINGYIDNYLKELVDIRLEEGSQLYSVQIGKVIKVRIVGLIGIIFISILFMIFGTYFSESVTKPIRELADRSMKMADGELKGEHIHVPYKDEIGVLTTSFNKMRANLHDMVKSLEDKVEIEKRLREDELKIADMNQSLKEAQFLSLQSQISPHFLFNTLNTIARTSMFEKAPSTVKLIESLSNIFRYTLNSQNRIVTLSEEIEILNEYMHIQKIRYGNRLKFKIDNNLDLSSIKIPIFTIQPLIENAIKYGIEPNEAGGSILLKIEKTGESIRLSITDTGPGITREDIDRILSNDNQILSDQSTGIGITNVRRRLSLAFQDRESFEIRSSLGEGTTIIMTVPGDASV